MQQEYHSRLSSKDSSTYDSRVYCKTICSWQTVDTAVANPIHYKHAPLSVFSATRCQQPPVTLILSCISCLQEPHVKRGQVVSDVARGGGGSFLQGSGVGSDYLVRVYLPIRTSHNAQTLMRLMREAVTFGNGRWTLFSYAVGISISESRRRILRMRCSTGPVRQFATHRLC